MSDDHFSPSARVRLHPQRETRYNSLMGLNLAVFGMHLLEVAFFAGLIGSSVVVIISFIEDGKELFGKDEK